MAAGQQLPPIALVVTSRVADFDTWKGVFDKHQSAREAAHFVGHHINRGEEDPNLVATYMPGTDPAAARAFLASPDLKEAMAEAGVISAPEAMWVTPKRYAIVEDREVPAMIITHTVADVDAWLVAYDEAEGLRKASGIIGHAASHSLDDASTVVIYHQAEDFDTLRNFMGNPELRTALEAAGVTSPPDVNYFTGGWGAFY